MPFPERVATSGRVAKLSLQKPDIVPESGNDALPACDLVSLSGILRTCSMEIVPIKVNDPRAIVEAKTLGSSIACTIESAFPFRAQVALAADRCLLGYVHHTNDASWCHGLPLATDSTFVLLPGETTEFLFAACSRVCMLAISQQQLRQALGKLTRLSATELPLLHRVYRPQDPVIRQQLRQLYEAAAGHDGIDSPSPNKAEPAGAHAEKLLLAHLAKNLTATSQDLPRESRRVRKHFLIVQRTEQFMRSHLRSDIYVREMCAAAGVSERSLRYAFEDLLGISPNRYLSLLRLCTACKSLTSSEPQRQSVKSVALSCGLWDLSRFADSYRKVFGELPHNTLMRAPAIASC